ncbi:MAG: tRNA pseudouridine(55) synthase TruB [Proteobacteria bacterium]|nr:tRNA pseudouridine(55) synthase TruB [Pseudomonadota bacterium]
MTSAAVVARVKRTLQARRVGHTGTLDPMATGVLPVCVGEGTKIAGYLLAEDKVYQAEIELGVETDTLDADGTIVARNPQEAALVTRDLLDRVLAEMVGPGEQIPPMHSAIKRGGKRLYQLARQGKSVERQPRPIVIHRLTLDTFTPPRVGFSVHCSKGTYVRSLAADIGRRLGCGAHLTSLRRTRSADFELDQSLQLNGITTKTAARSIISPARALAHLPAITVPENRVAEVASGKLLPWSSVADTAPPSSDRHDVVKLLLPTGDLVALARVEPDGRLRYSRVFTYGLTKARTSSNLSGSETRGLLSHPGHRRQK